MKLGDSMRVWSICSRLVSVSEESGHAVVLTFLDVERPVRVHRKGHHRAKDCWMQHPL